MSGAMNTKRRDFLKSAGGIVVAFSWSVPPVLAQQPARPALPGSLGTNRMLNGWIRINPAGTVTRPPGPSSPLRRPPDLVVARSQLCEEPGAVRLPTQRCTVPCTRCLRRSP